MLCSDVASRGVDVPRLPVVINFDPPPSLTVYTHRLGRTGRQGAAGTVISLLKLDAPSRAFAADARRLFDRLGEPPPEDISQLLQQAAACGEPRGGHPPSTPDGPAVGELQAHGSLLDFAATFAA
ncbi:MAG: hypothetical protein SGPRY_007928 [Prymnesium sp.]